MPLTGFRRMWLADWRTRLVDNLLHASLAVIVWKLGGPWFWQYWPDVFMLVMFPYSWWTDKMLASDNVILDLHRLLHSWTYILVGTSATLVGMSIAVFVLHDQHLDYYWLWVSGQLASHLLIDRYTHNRWKQYEERNNEL